MARQKPSGDGSLSRRFATVTQPDGTKLKVPVVKDAGTFIYLANPDGSWPKTSLACVLADLSWLAEGAVFGIEESAPGQGMGRVDWCRVAEQRPLISVDRTGKYSKFAQLKRLVLVEKIANPDDIAELGASDLEDSNV